MSRRIISLFIIIVCVTAVSVSSATPNTETSGIYALLSGKMSGSLHISISSPVFLKLSQFGEERINSLNRLMQHFSFDININNDVSDATVSVDSEPIIKLYEGNHDYITVGGDHSSGNIIIHNKQRRNSNTDDSDSISVFLETHFFQTNRMLDDLYNICEKLPEAFPDLSKTETSGISYKGYGKAVRKNTIQFKQDYVQEHLPKEISVLAESDEISHFINSLVFQGTQRITIQYDTDNRIISITYIGTVGLTEESLRKVSLTWRCMRKENHIKDTVLLKTPSVKGFDKYNLSFERELNNDPEESNPVLNWDYQLDQKESDIKRKLQYKANLSLKDNQVNGDILFNEKKNGREQSTRIVPRMEKEIDQSYGGTIEITNKTGKIEISSIKMSVTVYQPDNMLPQINQDAVNTDINKIEEQSDETLYREIYSHLIRKLITLPESDTEFLRKDIPENLWYSITESIHP